jgi:predicted nucleic acid-binding protein
MTVVIDASVALAWIYSDERTGAVEHVLDRVVEGGASVPAIWRLEIANGLQQGMRQQRIDATMRQKALTDLIKLNIAVDPETNTFAWNDTSQLADRFRLTPYDASYLELAQRRELPLASLDRDLRRAGRELGLELLGV